MFADFKIDDFICSRKTPLSELSIFFTIFSYASLNGPSEPLGSKVIEFMIVDTVFDGFDMLFSFHL